MKVEFINSINDINKEEWNTIINSDYPFLKYEFLESLEKHNCVSEERGWSPFHVVVSENDKKIAIMPMYIKTDSQGEFIFDWSWADAFYRNGVNYYPKLVSAIPFTPCETEKIIGEKINSLFINEVVDLMNSENIETWHILFPDEMLKDDLQKNNFIERNGYKFVWKNKNYSNFDDYLSIFKSRQRKNIRTERKKISDLDIYFEVKDAKSLTENDWNEFYTVYKNTYEERLQIPYLNIDFFKMVHENRESIKPVIFFANIEDKKIAGSLCFESNNTLYGRHWGSVYNIDSLHFECCYYQGIEYCIKNKIDRFDPGVQGEHKIRRGFEPMLTSSFHYIKEQDFFNAINDFCLKERKEIKIYLKACERYTPFKKGYKI